MKPRLLIFGLAAAVVCGLTVWRLQRPAAPPGAGLRAVARRLAPRFELYDHRSQMVKFERYLGRTRIVLVFFDGDAGADRSVWLDRLRACHERLESTDVQVVAVSAATPFANREAEKRGGEFPFPLLADVDLRNPIPAPVHHQFGLYDDERLLPRTGLFLIDRAGMVAWSGQFPIPVADPDQTVERLCRGEWPE